jgi:hypothetical protein
MLLAVTVAALIVAPHALWLASNLAQATSGTLHKMGATAALPWGEGVLHGLKGLGVAVVAFLTPLWIFLVLFFVRRGWREGVVPGPGCGLMRRYLAIVVALLLALVFVAAVTHFKSRWLQPFLFVAPMAFFACAPQLQRHPRLPAYRRLLALWAVLLVALIAARAPFNGWRGNTDELNLPAAALVQALRDAGYDGRPVVSTNRVLGGVLRLHFAPAPVVVVDRGRERLPDGATLWIGPGDGPEALAAIEKIAGRPAHALRALALRPAHAPASAAPLAYTFSLQP